MEYLDENLFYSFQCQCKFEPLDHLLFENCWCFPLDDILRIIYALLLVAYILEGHLQKLDLCFASASSLMGTEYYEPLSVYYSVH